MSGRFLMFTIIFLVEVGLRTNIDAGTVSTTYGNTGSSESSVTESTWNSSSYNYYSQPSTTSSHANPTPTVIICSNNYFCDRPMSGSSTREINGECACPRSYLNINDSCCMHQNWVIGLACGVGGLVIFILVLVIVGIATREHHEPMAYSRETGSKNSLVNDHEYMAELSESNGKIATSAVLTTLNEPVSPAEIQVTPPTTQNDELKADKNPVVKSSDNNNADYDYDDDDSINHYDDVRLPNQNSDYYNHGFVSHPDPLVNDILRSDVGINFKPHLEHIDSTTNYNIRRPTVVKRE